MGGQEAIFIACLSKIKYFGLSLVGYSKERKAQILESRVKRVVSGCGALGGLEYLQGCSYRNTYRNSCQYVRLLAKLPHNA
jgi:hypothetical protein